MYAYFFTFRSITPAQRGAKVLDRAGIDHVLQRTPRAVQMQGCGYCIRVHEEDYASALRALQANAVPYSRVFVRTPDGRWEALP